MKRLQRISWSEITDLSTWLASRTIAILASSGISVRNTDISWHSSWKAFSEKTVQCLTSLKDHVGRFLFCQILQTVNLQALQERDIARDWHCKETFITLANVLDICPRLPPWYISSLYYVCNIYMYIVAHVHISTLHVWIFFFSLCLLQSHFHSQSSQFQIPKTRVPWKWF